MRERFDDQEWELLRHVLYSAFSFVTGADGKIEPQELAAVADTINHPDLIEDPLHRELALDYKTRGDAGVKEEEAFQVSEDDDGALSRVMRTKGFLKDKLTAAEYDQFLTSLVVHCGVTDVHRKKHLFGRHHDERLSKEDAECLGRWAAIWDLDRAALARYTGD